MAAVDRRPGVVRRGATPAAPKPINLPSQKLENHRLVPDVEIVPRGTCSWGSARRPAPACDRNADRTDSASLQLGTDGIEDDGINTQKDSNLTDEALSPAEKSDLVLSLDSSTSPASSTGCITLADALMRCNPGVGDGNAKSGKGSATISDTISDVDSFPESVARPSSSESNSSLLATPTPEVTFTEVEVQKHSAELPEVCPGSCLGKQEMHSGDEAPRGSQDFGYFEGFYSTQAPFSRPGMPYPNGLGMAFGPGLHAPEPPQHYSFLGVPYYDSVKDKEIVVITMVGSPGIYGSYLPYLGFPDQYSGPSVYGNVPLQFGHFEHCTGPQASLSGMNSMCSGGDSGIVYHEQDNYKQNWFKGSPAVNDGGNNGVRFPTSLSSFELNPISEAQSLPKRTGRQKIVHRNRRADSKETSSTILAPERRVTLLTKVSQHEVIISNVQSNKKHGGTRKAKVRSGPDSFSLDVMETLSDPRPTQDGMELPDCAQPHEVAVPLAETSCIFGTQVQSGASRFTIDQAALESDGTAVVGEDQVEKSCALDAPSTSSAHKLPFVQATSRMSSEEDSVSVSVSNKDTKSESSEHLLRSELIASPHAALTSASSTTFQAQSEMAVQLQGLLSSSDSETLYPVPASSMGTFSVPADNMSEVRCVSKLRESHTDNPSSDSIKLVSMEVANDHLNNSETLSVATAASLPTGITQGSVQGLLAQKRNRKWRPKGSVDVIKLTQESLNQKVQCSLVHKGDTKKLSRGTPRDALCTAGDDSLPSFPARLKVASQEDSSSSSCSSPAALLSCNKLEVSSESSCTEVSLMDTVPDRVFMCKKSKKGAIADLKNGGAEVVPRGMDQVLDGSMKTVSSVRTQNLRVRIVSCGGERKWRPKVSGDTRYESATHKDPEIKASKAALISNVSCPEVNDNASAAVTTVSNLLVNDKGLSNNHTSSRDGCEALHDEYGRENTQKPVQIIVESRRGVQDKGCKKFSDAVSFVPEGSMSEGSSDHRGEKTDQHLSDNGNKLSLSVQKQHRSDDLSLTHAIRTPLLSTINQEDFNVRGSLSLRNKDSRNKEGGKQGHTWRVVEKQAQQQKSSLVSSKLKETEHSQPVIKSKDSVYFLQGAAHVSWKPKQSFFELASMKGSVDVGNHSVAVDVNEQGNRKPFSMKSNFLNNDNRKAAHIQQSLPYSSISMEHAKVRENIHAVAADHGKCHFSRFSTKTYMKQGQCGEFHAVRKVDRKGWVVKSASLQLKA